MANYANQKHLKIVKKLNPVFTSITQLDWIYAKKKLSPAEFTLYLLLATNEDGYEFDFSPQLIANTGLMDVSTARKARKA